MEFGYFAMPSHPPERGLKAGHDWDLQTLRWLDELGYTEAWIGEHHTAPWEPHPAPDLLIAQALLQTKRIRIGPGGFLLPYHHPAELANRVAMLDHLSEGRLNFGVAASGLPSDWAMFQVDGKSGVHREMTRESLDIILRLWSDEKEFDYDGKFWKVAKPARVARLPAPAHLSVAEAASADRRGRRVEAVRHAEAGRRARLPADEPQPQSRLRGEPLGCGGDGRRTHRAHAEPRRLAAGARGVRRRYGRGGVAAVGGRHDGPDDAGVFPAAAGEFRVPGVLQARHGCGGFRRDAGVLREAQLAGRLARDGGGEDRAKCTTTPSGFGGLLVFGFDYADNPQAWHNSLRLLAEEVGPRVAHLVPGRKAAAE